MLESLKSKLWQSRTAKLEDQKNQEAKDKIMFDKIFGSFKDEAGFPHMVSVMNALNQVVAHFEDQYVKDQNLRNASIDALCELLNSLKKGQ